MAINSPRYRRVFAQLQSSGLRTINNTAGTWSNTGAKVIRVPQNAIKLTPNMPITPVPWLTGTRSIQPGVRGRKSGSWSLSNVPLIPSGTAGTAPDIDPILQNVFGAAPTIVASTSATYGFTDTGYLPLTLLDFIHGSTALTSRVMWGCFTTDWTITLNGDVLTTSFSGMGGFLLDSDYFSSEDTTAKAGLTSFPLEPGSPTTAGSIIPGFGATATFNSQSIETKVRALSIRVRTGFRLIGDTIADFYPAQAVGGARRVTVNLGVIDDDTSQLQNLKQQAKSSAAPSINASIVIGTTAGSRVTFNVNAIQLVPQDFEDQDDIVMANFPDADAHATAIGNVDDMTVAFT